METSQKTNQAIPDRERLDFYCVEAMKGIVRVIDRRINQDWVVAESIKLGEALMAGVDARHAEIVASTGSKKDSGGKGK